MLRTLRLVERSLEVRLELEHARAGIIDAETAERGYLLTGKEPFLEMMEPSVQTARHSLDSLRALTLDNPVQQKRLDRLMPLFERKVARMDNQVKLRQEEGLEVVAAAVGTPEGWQLMDDIRGAIYQMGETEDRLLSQRTLAAQTASRITLGVVSAGSASLILLMALAAWMTRRELSVRKNMALVQKTARLYAESIVDTVQEPLLVLSYDLRVERANRAYYETFDTSPAETENRLLSEIGQGQWNHPRLAGLVAAALKLDEKFDDVEWAYDLPTTGRRTVLLSGRKLYRPGNHTEAVLLAIDDVTVPRQTEQALRTSEEQFRTIVESVEDYAILMLDAEGCVVSWNRGAERSTGYQAEEMLGRHFSRLYPPEDIDAGKPERELTEARNSGRVEDEGWRVRKDGTRFFCECDRVGDPR